MIKTFAGLFAMLALMSANGAIAQVPTCTLGGSCQMVIPTCRWDDPSNRLPPPPPTLLNVAVSPTNPNAFSRISGVFRFNGIDVAYPTPQGAIERIGNSLRITYASGYNPFIPLPQQLCYFDLGTLEAGDYHLEFWLAANGASFAKVSEVDFSVAVGIPIPTLSVLSLLVLSLVLAGAAAQRSPKR